jgi:hypothetical protein
MTVDLLAEEGGSLVVAVLELGNWGSPFHDGLQELAVAQVNVTQACLCEVLGVCQTSCPPISCGVSDFRGADFVFGV